METGKSMITIFPVAPVFTCEKYHYHVSLHSNISVPCLLLSNPQSTLNWSLSRAHDSPASPPVGIQIVQKVKLTDWS